MERAEGRAHAPADDDGEAHNRAFWDADADDYQAAHRQQFARELLAWGVWGQPESELRVLGDVRDLDVLELGCGSAQWSVGLAQRGARPVGLDISIGQLRHAARRVREAAVAVPLVLASATAAPFADGSFDIVFCDHGAMSFCDPARTVPEVSRLLRSGGLLAFNHTSRLVYMTYDEDADRFSRKLRNSPFARRAWPNEEGTIDWCIAPGEWLRIFAEHDLHAEDLVELRPAADATTSFEGWPTAWARAFPAEEIWKVRKRDR